MVATAFIKRTQFLGSEKIFTKGPDGLTDLMRGIARMTAQNALNAKITPLVDNSGGVPFAGSVVPPIQTAFTPITQAGSNAVSKANMETAFTAVTQAIADIAAQLVLINGVVQLFPGPNVITNNSGLVGLANAAPVSPAALVNNIGLAGVSTIAPIPVTFTGVNAAEAQVAGSSTLLAAVISQLDLLMTVANAFVPTVIGSKRSASPGNASVFPAPTGGIAAMSLEMPDFPGYLITNNINSVDSFLTSAGFPLMSLTTGPVSDGTALSQVATAEAATVFTALANTIATVRQTVNNLRTITYPLYVAAVG